MAEAPDENATKLPSTPIRSAVPAAASSAHDDPKENQDDGDEDDDTEGPDEEPKLKYHRLTDSLTTVYRNGDATSSFLVSGDKMIIGTHNGNINVLSMPSFTPLRTYHAHSASITSVSCSPFPVPFPNAKPDTSRSHPVSETPTSSPARGPSDGGLASPRTPRPQVPVPASTSNSIYIATSSIDGHVCVASLVDSKDVMLRNFARPVQAVALSPEFKTDRSYLSGGLAGNLILTTGGKSGVSANANTNSAAAAASGWLSSIGLTANTGRDTILHSGEGTIHMIKWSRSGKFVVWANEHGIKIMRTNIKLESTETDSAWTRIAHIDRPARPHWEEMASVWKARAEWIDEAGLEADEDEVTTSNGAQLLSPQKPDSDTKNGHIAPKKKKKVERLVVGWGDAVWILQVKPESGAAVKESARRSGGNASIVQHLLFDDCVVSGASLYTPSLLFILAYRTRDDNDNPIPVTAKGTPRRGVFNRQTGLSPELRLINIMTKEEIDADTLTVSRYESLQGADYHLGTLYVPPKLDVTQTGRSAFGAFGVGIWDVGLNATRIFSSATSVKSGTGSTENAVASPSLKPLKGPPSVRKTPEINPAASSQGLKLFIVSPYDCVLAVKRDLSDRLTWLLDHEQYKEAWELVNENPDIIPPSNDDISIEDTPSTPTRPSRQSLLEFFADNASQTTISVSKTRNRTIEHEKRRIGELWIQQLVKDNEWTTAGQVAGRVLGPSPRWEHWVWRFAQAGHFDEITPYVPTTPVHPPIPSVVYERLLGHYINRDCLRFKELIESWDPSLVHIPTITSAIEKKLSDGDVREDTIEGGEHGRDWRILMEALAKLEISDNRPREALRCYIKLQNAEAAMSLISDYHLVEAIADDIPAFLTMRISKEQLGSATVSDLEEASVDAVRLLVDEALHGILQPRTVVQQLEDKGKNYRPFLYLYIKSLWKGDGLESHSHRVHQQLESEGRILVDEFGDLVVGLFAEYDRELLMKFLRASRSYSYEKATAICEQKNFYPELVYILSQTGQTKRALGLIINSLGDVQMAIEFAKEQDDPGLWDDLLDFSMNKPSFIRGLLENVGTAIDPIKLVRRIPEGLEIEGLREGIHHMLREYEIQGSISEGVARVLRSEVATSMEALRSGRAKGIKFDIVLEVTSPIEDDQASSANKADPQQSMELEEMIKREAKPGQCVECRKPFHQDEKDILIGFACGHVYHLSCIIANIDDPIIAETAKRLQSQVAADADDHDQGDTRSVGAKVAHAHILKSVISKGCPSCLLVGD